MLNSQWRPLLPRRIVTSYFDVHHHSVCLFSLSFYWSVVPSICSVWRSVCRSIYWLVCLSIFRSVILLFFHSRCRSFSLFVHSAVQAICCSICLFGMFVTVCPVNHSVCCSIGLLIGMFAQSDVLWVCHSVYLLSLSIYWSDLQSVLSIAPFVVLSVCYYVYCSVCSSISL